MPLLLVSLCAPLCALLLFGASLANAQEPSYDGQRWVEIEVTVFTHEGPELPAREVADPEQTTLSYPARLRRLDSRSALYGIDFPDPAPSRAESFEPLPAALPPPLYGPAPAVSEREFRVVDLERDAFVALEGQARQFGELNRRLRESGRRLLWHAAWRLPALPIGETSPVFVRGGERYGEHNELEGSVTVSAIPGGVDLHVNLWLNRFTRFGGDSPAWRLPEQPFPPDPGAAGPGFLPEPAIDLRVSEVAHIRQIHSVTSERLHYFDHPAFGVLVQVRPYQLPEPLSRFALE